MPVRQSIRNCSCRPWRCGTSQPDVFLANRYVTLCTFFLFSRERVEEATSVQELDQIRSEVSAHIDQIIQKLGDVYDSQHDLDATKRFAVELQYMVKCAEEIDMREEQLEA
jgi:hypothetical protein